MSYAGVKCDFCSALGPTWVYPARDFDAYIVSPIIGESIGAWAACEACHRLIEAGDREGLAVRSLDELIMSYPEAVMAAPTLKQELLQLHELFFANRSGTAIRAEPEPA